MAHATSVRPSGSRSKRNLSSFYRPPAAHALPDWSLYSFEIDTADVLIGVPIGLLPATPAAQPATEAAPPEPTAARILTPHHGPDFRSVSWPIGGELVRFGPFTALQAAVVRVLWEAFENGTPDVGGDYLLEHAGSDREHRRIDAIFVNSASGGPAWGRLIVSRGKGSYRLADPS